MKENNTLLCSLISFIIVFSLASPVFPAAVEASPSAQIRDWYDLHTIRNDLDGHYRLMNDLDATTAGYMELASATANDGKGWLPIGTSVDPFSGSFDGQEYEIRDLFANRPAENGVGLFGCIAGGGVIEDVGLVNGDVTGAWQVGGLAGWNEGSVSNFYSSGTVSGDTSTGGLIGVNNHGKLSNSYSNASVRGQAAVGGLVGWNGGTVSNSYFGGTVSGNSSVGGLVGHNIGDLQGGSVSNSYSTGSVTGTSHIGGLVGYNLGGIVSNSFWDTETSGLTISAGGTGKTTAEMMSIATFTDINTQGLDQPWDMTAVDPEERDDTYTWNMVDGASLPFLSGKQLMQHDLTISSAEGGQVTTPGEGTHAYDAGTVVNLAAEAEEGYRFVDWTGNVDTIGDFDAAETTIVVQGDYTIRANFEEVPPAPVRWPLIGAIVAAVLLAGLAVFAVRRRRAAQIKRR